MKKIHLKNEINRIYLNLPVNAGGSQSMQGVRAWAALTWGIQPLPSSILHTLACEVFRRNTLLPEFLSKNILKFKNVQSWKPQKMFRKPSLVCTNSGLGVLEPILRLEGCCPFISRTIVFYLSQLFTKLLCLFYFFLLNIFFLLNHLK